MDGSILHVAEAVGADDRPAMDADAAADLRARVEGDVGKQVDLLAQWQLAPT